MSIDSLISEAVNLAAQAWDKNEDLRKLFGSARPNAKYPLLVSGGNVGLFLKKIRDKRQIVAKSMPRDANGNFALAHAVIGPNDYFEPIFNEKYAVRETILVDKVGFINQIRNSVTFANAKTDAQKATNPQLRAVILLHEARHLYALSGHGVDPASYDGIWNDYILWTGFQGQKVAW